MTTISFYQALGNLFYAVAKVDKKIVLLEKQQINELILDEWNQTLGTIETKELIYQTLRELIAENVSSEKAFDFFKTFLEGHQILFTEEIKKKIMLDVEAITAVYAHRNKSELILLTDLNRLLQKIKN